MNKLTQQLGISTTEWAQLWQEAFNQGNNIHLKRELLTYAHAQTLSTTQQKVILNIIRQQVQGVELPANVWSLHFDKNQTGYKASFGLAIAAILSAMGQKIILTGEKSYSTQANIGDILLAELINGAKTAASLQKKLDNKQVAYLNPADWVAGWSDWDFLRTEWANERILSELEPLIFANNHSIFVLKDWAQGRFYQNLGTNGHFLHDKSGSGWISLRHDWQWATAAEVSTHSVSEQPFEPQTTALFPPNEQKETAAEAFSHLQRLLSNEISTQERELLLINAAFIAMQLQPNGWIGAIAEAEAALASGRARKAILF